MEDPHFIKCEPEWLQDTKEYLKSEPGGYFPADNLTRVKTEAVHSSDAELNTEEDNRDSFSACDTQILKEEIIKEEEDINRINALDDDLDLPSSSSNVLQGSMQVLNFSIDFKSEDEIKYPSLKSDEVLGSGAHHKKHINVTNSRKGAFKCKECNRLFTWRQNLWDHVKIHRGEKTFQCTLCAKAFLRLADLKRHMVIHTGKRAFACSLCGKMFNVATNLTEHIKLHSGARPFACGTCNMMFRSKGNLKKHMKIHTGLRPFGCSYCGKAFLESATLKKHLRLHSNSTP